MPRGVALGEPQQVVHIGVPYSEFRDSVPLLAAVGHGFVDVVRINVVVLGVAAEVVREVFADPLAELAEPLLRGLEFLLTYWLLIPCHRLYRWMCASNCGSKGISDRRRLLVDDGRLLRRGEVQLLGASLNRLGSRARRLSEHFA